MNKIDVKNVAYYGNTPYPFYTCGWTLTKAELIEALMEMTRIINDCPDKIVSRFYITRRCRS